MAVNRSTILVLTVCASARIAASGDNPGTVRPSNGTHWLLRLPPSRSPVVSLNTTDNSRHVWNSKTLDYEGKIEQVGSAWTEGIPSGEYVILSAGIASPRSAKIVDARRMLEFHFVVESGALYDLKVSPDRTMLAVTATDVLLYDIRTMQLVRKLPRPILEASATALAFSPDGKHLIVTYGGDPNNPERGSRPFLISRWRLTDYQLELTKPCDQVPHDMHVLPDGERIAIVYGPLHLFDFNSLEYLQSTQAGFDRYEGIRSIDFTPSGSVLLANGQTVGTGMRVVDTRTWQTIAAMKQPRASMNGFFASDGTVVYSNSEDPTTIHRWDWKQSPK